MAPNAAQISAMLKVVSEWLISYAISGAKEKTKRKCMIERVLKGRNIREACRQVVSNKGVAGVDGMTVKEIRDLNAVDQKALCDQVRSGKYVAQPILGVSIPKGNGKTRMLGIPTVVDRLLQQAVHQSINPFFEVEFKDHSYVDILVMLTPHSGSC